MPSGTINQTSCKECVFAIYDGNTQTGCKDDRISKFKEDVIEAYDEEKEFYVINRTCTLYRTKNWNNGEIDLVKAKNESSVIFDIFFDCDNINREMVDYIKQFIHKQSKNHNIIVFSGHDVSDDKKNLIKEIFYSCPNINMSMYFDKREYLHTNLSKTNNAFHTILDSTNFNDLEEFIININKLMNEELKKGLIFYSNGKTAILTLACRIFYPNLYLDYDNLYPDMIKKIQEGNLYIEC